MDFSVTVVKDSIKNVLFYNGGILYSSGSMLHGVVTCKFDAPIHRIKIHKDFLVISLLKELIILQGNRPIFKMKFNDWILDFNVGETVLVLFAHNYVKEFSMKMELLNFKKSKRFLLYSGLLVGDHWDRLIIFSGTIFNGIQVWNTENHSVFLSGHEGVIFHMHYRDGLLASCSDDRTIRIWQVENLIKNFDLKGNKALDNKGDNLSIVNDNGIRSYQLFGHQGRVWKCMIYEKYFISVSEDATCKFWDKASYECIASFHGHGSKNVWSFDFDPNKSILVTGGGDGGIKIWDVDPGNCSESVIHQMCNTKGLTKALRNNLVESSGIFCEEPKTFCLIDMKTVVVLTSKGNFILYCRDQDPTCIYSHKMFGSSPILAKYDKRLFATNMFGQLLIFDHTIQAAKVFQICSVKICGLFVVENNIFIFCGENMHLAWLRFENQSLYFVNYLQLPKHFFVVELKYDASLNAICIGSRKGAFCFFDLGKTSANQCLIDGDIFKLDLLPINPSLVYRHLHSTDAVTCIIMEKDSKSDNILIHSVGRDGMYVQSIISKQILNDTSTEESENEISLVKQHKTLISKGWLEKILKVNGETLILGFYAKQFFIFNETKNIEEFTINCGGGHRAWDIIISNDLLFGYYKHKCIYNVYKKPTIQREFLESFHVLDAKAVDICQLNGQQVLITGGEDGVLMFHLLGSFKRIGICKEKLGSIKSLVWKEGFLFTGGSQEELIIWKVLPILENDMLSRVACIRITQVPFWGDEVEIRVMSVSVLIIDGIFYIFSGNSDGSCRLYTFNPLNNLLNHVYETLEHIRCVLKTDAVHYNGQYLFLSGCTGGKLFVWKLLENGQLTRLHCFSLLQNGFKSIHTKIFKDYLQILVGGDDNSTVVLQMHNGFHYIFKNFTAHSSSVTGCFQSEKYLYTISVDRRLNQLVLSPDGSLTLTSSKILDIPDLADMAVLDSKGNLTLACVGHGLTICKIIEN
jgi:WD40 repeat protein